MRSRLEVLVVGPSPSGKGGISSVLAWFAGFEDALPGYHISVAASHPGTDQRTPRTALASLRETSRVVRRIRRERPDIVHVLTGPRGSIVRKSRVAKAARRAGARVVVHVHSGTVERTLMGDVNPEAPEAALRRLMRDASVVATLWRGPRAGMRRFGQGAIWRVCGNAVAIPDDAPGSSRDVQVAFVGRVTAEKGAALLAELGAVLHEAGVGLTIAGDAGDQAGRACLDALAGVESVELLGWVEPDQVTGLLRRAKVLVLPSEWEALPVAALEAMASGCVVVGRPVGALPELLGEGRGVLADGDASEWGRLVRAVLADEPERAGIARRARAHVDAHFADERVREQVSALYDAAVLDIDRAPRECTYARVDVLGFGFDPLTMDEAVARAAEHAEQGLGGDCVSLNASKLVAAPVVHALRVILSDPLLALADGASVVWASRVLKRPLPERVAGIDFAERLLGECEARGLSVFLLGSSANTLERVASWAAGRFPGLEIAGTQDGYYRDSDAVARAVIDSGARVLLIGMTSPLGDAFTVNFPEVTRSCVSVMIGGSFDVWAGTLKRAPAWMQRVGLEWAYRLMQEPGRLLWRYLSTNATFVVRVWMQRLSELGG